MLDMESPTNNLLFRRLTHPAAACGADMDIAKGSLLRALSISIWILSSGMKRYPGAKSIER